jgi:hypothetical protein
MKSEEFVIWFKGFVAGSNNHNLTPAGWEAVKAQLEKVGEEKVEFKSEEKKFIVRQLEEVKGISWEDILKEWSDRFKDVQSPPNEVVPKTIPLPYITPAQPQFPYWWQQPSTVEPFKVTCSTGSGIVSVQSSGLVDASATGTVKPPQFFTYTSTPNQK